MRIALEALGIDQPGGGRVATLNLLKPLLALGREHEFFVYLSAPEPELAGLHPKTTLRIVPVRNRFLSRVALQFLLPVHRRRDRIDLVHFVKNQVIPGTGARTVATVYDLTTLRHPEAYPAVDVWYWRHVLPRQYRKVDRLIAISATTRDDLVTLYGLPSEGIAVIHCACDPEFRVPTPAESSAVLGRHGLEGTPYFVHVGNLSIKKNLALLVEAFLDFKRRTGFPGKLVFAGAEYHKGRDERFFELVKSDSARNAILLAGPVSKVDLIGLYGGAIALLFPSLHEGFGLVALEAMACGAPVVTHAAGAVQEVVGDAAIVINSPTDVREWSTVLERIATDSDLRDTLRRAGFNRLREFAPERVAQETLALYRSVAG